jgi:hypothetical protein
VRSSVRGLRRTDTRRRRRNPYAEHNFRTHVGARTSDKLKRQADFAGFVDPIDMVKEAIFDGVSPGICVVCDATVEVEPDQDRGWCEECREGFIVAAPVLAGVI